VLDVYRARELWAPRLGFVAASVPSAEHASLAKKKSVRIRKYKEVTNWEVPQWDTYWE